MKHKILITFLVFSQTVLYASHPFVRNFIKKSYSAGNQNWDIVQDNNRWMYFANKNGLLEFDGNQWEIYPIKNHTAVCTLFYDKKSERIYAGAYNEFGYYYRASNGILKYESLTSKHNIKSNFKEIRKISKLNEDYYFQSDYDVFVYSKNKIIRYSSDDRINCSAVINKTFIIYSDKKGLTIFNEKMFLPFVNSEILKNKKVCSILPYSGNKILFVTDYYGIYIYNGQTVIKFNTKIDSFLEKNQVLCADIKNNQLAIGTLLNGMVVLNINDFSTVYSNSETGLQNNTILSIKYDDLDNLWLGLNNGIDYVMINSPVNNLLEYSNAIGAGYASIKFNNKLYLGTNQGLYVCDKIPEDITKLSKTDLKLIISGQIWSLTVIDNALFCASDNGGFILSNNEIERIKNVGGVWGFKQFKSNQNKILVSTYVGFFTLTKSELHWKYDKYLKGFDSSSNMFSIDSNENIWVCHNIDGTFQITLTKNLDSITKIIKLTQKNTGIEFSLKSNTLFELDNNINFVNEKGYYYYDSNKNKINKTTFLSHQFGKQKYSTKIFKSETNDYWSISNNRIKVGINLGHNKYRTDSTSIYILNDKIINGFENISYEDKNAIIGTENGFSIVSLDKKITTIKKFDVSIRKVSLTNEQDTVLAEYILYHKDKNTPRYNYKNNSLRFQFVSTEYRSSNSILYSYYLENYDLGWSRYSFKNSKEYTRLRNGKYIFHVKAKNLFTNQTAEESYKFIILPPWYLTNTAYTVYFMLIIIVIILIIMYLNKFLHKKIQHLRLQNEDELNKQKITFEQNVNQKEKEINELRNQQLVNNLTLKSQELANSTMNIVRKNEILIKSTENLNKISDLITHQSYPITILKLIEKMKIEIRLNIEQDENWKMFADNFDLIHDNFINRLTEKFPDLSVVDKKICAYIKMDLCSKDIAPLLNMSYRSVEMSRYRLRKKMQLEREINLSEFLHNF